MSTIIEVACDDHESLLDNHSNLKREDVCWGSESLPRLLFPEIYHDHYQGSDGGILGDLAKRHDLGCSLLQLADDEEITEDACVLLNQVSALLRHLAEAETRYPPLYLLEPPDGSRYESLFDGNHTVEGGYDYCVLTGGNRELIKDLRNEHEIQFKGKGVKILRLNSSDELKAYLRHIERIAKTAVDHNRDIVLRCE